MSEGIRSVMLALVLTMIAVIPLALMMAVAPSDPEPEAAPSTETTTPPPAPEVATVVVTTPPPDIQGVSEGVARVLTANGFAGEETPEGLPASVIAVLAERDIPLTIAVEP